MPTRESIAAAARSQEATDLPPLDDQQIERIASIMRPSRPRKRASDAA